jgi:6-phospho-3-hexuloisomerase
VTSSSEGPVRARLATIVDELSSVLARVDGERVEELAEAVRRARRVYLAGQGRSGLVGRMLAMRLMHLGLETHVVGEATAPAVGPGDLLIAISATGSTPTTLHQADRAVRAGAALAVLTAAIDGPLAQRAGVVVGVPTGSSGGVPTTQHAGSLFEQATLLVGDALAGVLQRRLGLDDAALDARHGNLQ